MHILIKVRDRVALSFHSPSQKGKPMASLYTEGTKFSLKILPNSLLSTLQWTRAEICIENEYISYVDEGKIIGREEMEEWIFSMFRLLAGGYKKEQNLLFERAGIAVDFYPYLNDGEEASLEERREKDCVMAVRLLMRSKDKKRLLGGVYSLLFHRSDIEQFAKELRLEFDENFARLIPGRGKYHFVGVSPLGFSGCNYWYLDESKKVTKGEYVWVTMGRHNREQIVLVDSVRQYSEDNAPYNPETVKRVLRKATDEEVQRKK